MPLRGSYLSLTRRLDELERRAERVAARGAGCAACAGWPALAVVDTTGELGPRPVPAGRLGDGGFEDAPRSGWPESLRCGGCGREPEVVIRLAYAEPKPFAAHAPDRADVYAGYAGDDEAE